MNSVKSAVRVLEVLELLCRNEEPIGVSEIARRLTMPKSSTSALIATLEERGYVTVGIGGVMLENAYRDVSWVGGQTGGIVRCGRPVMKLLCKETGESCFLGVPTAEFKVRYIEKSISEHPVRYDLDTSNERDAYCTTVGLILLSGMSDDELDTYFRTHALKRVIPSTIVDEHSIREAVKAVSKNGYAELTDSTTPGVSGVAAPVKIKGRIAAAISVIAPTGRFLEKATSHREAVIGAASKITKALTYA